MSEGRPRTILEFLHALGGALIAVAGFGVILAPQSGNAVAFAVCLPAFCFGFALFVVTHWLGA